MLSPAETDLVRRDRSLPGLGTVLDPDAFIAALRRAAPAADPTAAQITYLRYKPQVYCRVAYRLELGETELDVDVRACRPEHLSQWREVEERPSPPGSLGPGRIVLEDCAVVLNVFPNDLKLPQLQHLTDPVKRQPLLRELLPDRPDLWEGQLRCLRYRPERRYVAEFLSANSARAILKCYTRKAYARSKHNARAFQSSGLLQIARPLGFSDSRRVIAYEWMSGRKLMDLCLAPGLDCDAVNATGAALAMLHAQRPDGLDCWTRVAESADLASLSSELGFICPHLARHADDLARRLAARLTGAPALHCPVHGDFSANQVLVDGQKVAIIDLDWACHGDPADDLGNFIAQTERFSLRGELSSSRVEMLRGVLLEGYARATKLPLPERIGLYTAVQLFRRTRFPFRAREPDWPQRTESLLERAQALFNSLNQ